MNGKKCSVEEYYQLAEQGIFDNVRVELIEGVIIEKPSLTPREATAISLASDILREVFGKDFTCSIRLPLRFGEFSEPEPEVYISKGKSRDFLDSHPKIAEIVFEVSERSLDYLRSHKLSLYAKFGIKDYWILDLKTRTLEVHRQPSADDNAFYEFSFGEKLTFGEADEVSPLALPDAKIKITDLLP